MVRSQRDASVLRRFEDFCALEGFECDTALCDSAAIEAFLSIACSHLAPHSLGTYRSTLRRLGHAGPSPRRYPGSAAPPPYDDAELAALWSRAASQSSARRRDNATVLLAATLGAGLRPRELAALCASDLTHARGGVAVCVSGLLPRRVPVLAPYAKALLHVARERPGYLFRPLARRRETKNLVGEIAEKLVRDPDEVTLLSGRARSTFLCGHLARGTALARLCALAGLGDVESLLRYARHVAGAPQSKAALRAQLSRETRRR
jgi:integrase